MANQRALLASESNIPYRRDQYEPAPERAYNNNCYSQVLNISLILIVNNTSDLQAKNRVILNIYFIVK
jgi:hypothetical protein